jgi:hypothetical protein
MALGRERAEPADAVRVAVLGFSTTEYYRGFCAAVAERSGYPS